MRNPDNIAVLARAYALVLSIHKSPLRARGRRSPGLSSQLLRSISSIPFNIAEGAALDDPGFAHHLTIAIASAVNDGGDVAGNVSVSSTPFVWQAVFWPGATTAGLPGAVSGGSSRRATAGGGAPAR